MQNTYCRNGDEATRKLVLYGGGALVLYGATQRTLTGGLLMAFGGALVGMALSEEEREQLRRLPETARKYMQKQGCIPAQPAEKFDEVDEACMESFPASDPPSYSAR